MAQGDRVLVHSRNSFEFVETLFATLRLGAVWVPTNFRIAPDEAAYLAQASGAKVFLCQGDYADHAEAVARVPQALARRLGPEGFAAPEVADLIEAQRGAAPACVDVGMTIHAGSSSSGTTGRPKAAVLTWAWCTNHLCDLMPGTTEQDVSLAVAPLSHGAGIHLLTQVARAACTVLPASTRFDAEEIWQLVERHRVSNMFTVPTIVKMLVEHPAVDAWNHASLRYVIYAGAPMYREDQKRALEKLGPVLVQYFGLGEVTGNITVLPPACMRRRTRPRAPGHCGIERTGMQVSIQDDSGRQLDPGQPGEICVCGPAVFAGYYANPQANEKAFRDGWFRTGDLGYMDAEGFVSPAGNPICTSRAARTSIRARSRKVLTHPAVAESAVLGVPDPTWGEAGVMVCVLRAGHDLSEDELLAWMAPRMARLAAAPSFLERVAALGLRQGHEKLVRDALYERGCLDRAPELAR